jgi:hypothetical protein
MKGTLKPAQTWETKLSKAGQSDDGNVEEQKSAVWQELLEKGKLGYLAALRNIRNILATDSAKNVDLLCALLVKGDLVRQARIFPFQLLKAYEVIEALPASNRQVLTALSDALDISVSNIPVFEGEAAVLLDTSGSMAGLQKIGTVFAAALAKAWNADLMSWSAIPQWVNYNGRDSVMSIAQSIPFHNGGTNMSCAFGALVKKYSRVVVLSDMQTWVDASAGGTQLAWKGYMQRLAVRPHLYSFDLKNYGTMAIPEDRVYCLAGYSDKVFEVMGQLEGDRQALVNAIEAINLEGAEASKVVGSEPVGGESDE